MYSDSFDSRRRNTEPINVLSDRTNEIVNDAKKPQKIIPDTYSQKMIRNI